MLRALCRRKELWIKKKEEYIIIVNCGICMICVTRCTMVNVNLAMVRIVGMFCVVLFIG